MKRRSLYIISLSKSYQGESEIRTRSRKKRQLKMQQSQRRLSSTKQLEGDIQLRRLPVHQLTLPGFQEGLSTQDERWKLHPLLTEWLQPESDEPTLIQLELEFVKQDLSQSDQ